MGEIDNHLTPSEKMDKIEQREGRETKGVINSIIKFDSESIRILGFKIWPWRRSK